jgi:hypothetical protein
MRREPSRSEKRERANPRDAAAIAWGRYWRRMAAGVCFSVLMVGGVLILGSTATPQTETVASTDQTAPVTADPPGTIDGAKTPDLIPDDVALRMIVLAVAEPTDASDEAKERARAKIAPIGFSEEDAAAFLNLLAEYQDQVDAVDKQVAEVYERTPIPDPASTVYKQLLDLGKQKDRLTNDNVAAIPAKLSQDGLLMLSAYLPEAKKGMKIIP